MKLKPALLTAATTLASFALSSGSYAVTVNECDWVSNARNIVEPWDKNTRTFANGNVRLALMDVVEPAAAAFHILVLSPPYDELGTRQCREISLQNSIGFSSINFDALQASYDPSVGLMFKIPIQTLNNNAQTPSNSNLLFSLNQATGQINALLRD